MQNYLKYNLYSYLNKERKKFRIISVSIVIVFFLVFCYFSKIDAYNVYTTNAQIICDSECSFQFYYPVSKGFSYDFIKINGKKDKVENVVFGNVVMDSSNIGLQTILLKAKEYKGKQNEFVQIQIFKNKEKITKKIIKIIKER